MHTLLILSIATNLLKLHNLFSIISYPNSLYSYLYKKREKEREKEREGRKKRKEGRKEKSLYPLHSSYTFVSYSWCYFLHKLIHTWLSCLSCPHSLECKILIHICDYLIYLAHMFMVSVYCLECKINTLGSGPARFSLHISSS